MKKGKQKAQARFWSIDERQTGLKMGKFEELLLREGHGRDKCTSRGD